MSKPTNAPVTALPIPPPRGPFATEQLDTIAGISGEVSRENNVNKINWDGACTNWLLANTRNRDFGLALTPKPAPFLPQSFISEPDTDPQSGVVWIWQADGAPVTCPDLPALPVPVGPNNIHIGSKLYGAYWTAAADNTFNGADPIPGKSDDGVTGVWQFVGSAMGAGRGWYLKVG